MKAAFLHKLHVGFWLLCLLLPLSRGVAQTLPPCFERPHFIDPPWVNGVLYCLEEVAVDGSGEELAYTALTTAPDGTLYVAQPLAGRVLAMDDSNGDLLPDRSRIAAENLTLPNGLAYTNDALYIAGGQHIYRLAAGAAQAEILVDDLPVDPGGWAGDLVVGPDDRLYVSLGGVCDYCVPEHSVSILSFALDGTGRRVEASGLRQGAGLAFGHGSLWVTDSARSGLMETPDLDELNRITTGDHFGWPYCFGAANQPDTLAEDFDCSTATAPAYTLPTGSTPTGLAFYDSSTLPELEGALLVVLNGSRNRVDLRGYVLAAVAFDDSGRPAGSEILIPYQTDIYQNTLFDVVEMNYRGSGFWPHRPLDVTVSPEGWVYLSVSGGRIMVLRPS